MTATTVPPEIIDFFPQLIKWAQVIHSSAGQLDFVTLKSGRLFAEILHLSDDSYFSESWLETIVAFGDTAAIRVIRHNIGKVEAALRNYYAEQAHKKIIDNDLWKIADNIGDDEDDSTKQAIVAMACLVVSAPFFGHTKKEYVEKLMNQTAEVQEAMLEAIKFVTDNAPEIDEAEAHAIVNAQSSSNAISSVSQLSTTTASDEEYYLQLQACQMELAKVTKGKERLEKELEAARKRASNEPIDGLEKEIRRLKASKQQLEEQAIEMESERDVLKARVEELAAKNEDLEKKVFQTLHYEEELRRLRDEVEELRAQKQQMDDLSLAHEQLKTRNNELRICQQENQLLRNKVEAYVRQIAELEEAKNNRKQLHSQLGAYKAKAEEKERDAEGLMRKVDMLTHEHFVAKERISTLEVENRRLLEAKQEVESRLKLDGVLSGSANESQLMEHSLHEDMKLSLGAAGHNDERIRELEVERDTLLERVRSAETQIAQLESDLKVETKKKADAKKMLDDLEIGSDTEEEKKRASVDFRLQIENQAIEIDRLKRLNEIAERKAAEAGELVKRAQDEAEAQKKARQLTEGREQTYLEKAKLIIIDQDRRMQATSEAGLSVQEFDSLRRTIEQKDRQIKALEEKLTQTNNMHEQEQRLVTTSYYQMAQKVEQADRRKGALDSNGLVANGPKSFLSHHKQASAFSARRLRGPLVVIFTAGFLALLCAFIDFESDPFIFF